MTHFTSAATVAVPVSQLLQRLATRQTLLGISLTPTCTECAVLGPPYAQPRLVASGVMLSSDGLKKLVEEQQATGVLLGGTGLFRTDGQTQYGARKLISGILGIVYENDWLPKVADGKLHHTPVWLCRAGQDDPVAMLQEYIRLHTAEHLRRANVQVQGGPFPAVPPFPAAPAGHRSPTSQNVQPHA